MYKLYNALNASSKMKLSRFLDGKHEVLLLIFIESPSSDDD
jgi:hypothetical protein